MDLSVITTYRCNSKCSMCCVWQNPTLPAEEVSLKTLAKIPAGVDYLNLTGGEPTLREDLAQIVDLLHPKAMKLEISSNGLRAERLEPIVRKYPDIKIRFSLEGFGRTNDTIRGEKGGSEKKSKGLLRLKELGGTDLGFGVCIQDENAAELVDLFRFAQKHRVELATSTLHNAFQFHKNDNFHYDPVSVARQVELLIAEQLKTNSVKTWFRAYLNLGLMAKILGQPRVLKCAAGSDFAFVDPWSDVYACNVRPDLKMGNLESQTWDDVMNGPAADQARKKVSDCKQNCWMVGSAKTAMRNPKFARIPKPGPLLWVIENKLRVTAHAPLNVGKHVCYSQVHAHASVPHRTSYLDMPGNKRVQSKKDVHYTYIGEFRND